MGEEDKLHHDLQLHLDEQTDEFRAAESLPENAVWEARRSLERERRLLQSMIDGARNYHLVYLDRDFNFVHVNEAYAKTCGYRPNELVGKNHFDLYPHEENEAIFAGVRDSGIAVEFHDKPFIFPDQPERGITYWDWTLSPVNDTSGNVEGLVFSLFETTERKRAEEALKESEKRFHRLFEDDLTGDFLCTSEGKIILCNPAFATIFGFSSPGEVVGTSMFNLYVQPEEQDSILEALKRQGKLQGYEAWRKRRDGEPIHVVENLVGHFTDRGELYEIQGYIFDDTERKRAEEALLESKELFEKTFISQLDAIFLLDASIPPKIINCNPAAVKMFGYDREEMLGLATSALHVNEGALNRFEKKLYMEVEERGFFQLSDFEMKRKDGGIFPTDHSVIPLEDDEDRRTGWVSVVRDISNRKEAEEALRRSRDGLERRVQERTAELRQTNERLRAENEERSRTEQSLRLEEARLDALLQLSQLSEASLNEISNFALEQAIRLTNSKIGFVGFLNDDESIYNLHAVSKDVVRECNVTGDPLQWHVVDAGIWAEAVREHKTLFVNDYSKPHPKKRGLPPGHPYVERFMVVPILEGEKIIALAGVGNKALEYNKSDERQIVLLLNGMWTCIQKNRSREELQIAYNELEKANAELARYNRQLQVLNQELQDFAFVASHDLQEPLRKVKTFASMLAAKLGGSLDEVTDDYLKRMQMATARMQNLLNSLLAYSRVTTEGDPIQETDLGECVKEALSDLEIMIKEKSACVEVADLPTLRANRVQMVQLFQNLIGNALKFSREGETPLVRIYARELRDSYEIYVEDNGIGFDREYLEKIFLPFQRLHGRSSEYGGVGMGLAICKKIVERHGGRITARSETGKGSIFIVTLSKGRGKGDARG
jgi:PAS domain S-box-containing protein